MIVFDDTDNNLSNHDMENVSDVEDEMDDVNNSSTNNTSNEIQMNIMNKEGKKERTVEGNQQEKQHTFENLLSFMYEKKGSLPPGLMNIFNRFISRR